MSRKLPGRIVSIAIKEGVAVTKGQPLVVLEAMKIETGADRGSQTGADRRSRRERCWSASMKSMSAARSLDDQSGFLASQRAIGD
jgi:multidrug efflux pump subunit AcrA (membrane-fusion protein)